MFCKVDCQRLYSDLFDSLPVTSYWFRRSKGRCQKHKDGRELNVWILFFCYILFQRRFSLHISNSSFNVCDTIPYVSLSLVLFNVLVKYVIVLRMSIFFQIVNVY